MLGTTSKQRVSKSFVKGFKSKIRKSSSGFSGYLRRVTENQCKKIKVVYDQDRWICKTLIGRILEIGDCKLKVFCDESQSILTIPVNQINHVKLIDTCQVIPKWK
jgi:hypothetical protein